MRSGNRARKSRLSRKAQLISLAVGVLLIWQIVAISLAVSHGQSGADLAATDYEATSPAAATAAAERHLSEGDMDGAAVLARLALSRSPISAAALRILGLAEQNRGHLQAAGALFSQSAALGWRDLATQLWLTQAYIQEKDYVRAAERMDAALRNNPTSSDLLAVLDGLLVDPKFAAAMRQRMERNPGWRASYFRNIASLSPEQLDARLAFIHDLAASPVPPTRDEVLPLVDAMIRMKDYQKAHALWSRVQNSSAPMFDPEFRDVIVSQALRFGWTTQPLLGATLTPSTGATSPLSASTDGSASGTLMRQLTVLAPGPHRLGYLGTIPASMKGSLGWVVRCTASGKLAFNTMDVTGPPPYAFSIPADCDSQSIELRVGRNPSMAGSTAEFLRLSVN